MNDKDPGEGANLRRGQSNGDYIVNVPQDEGPDNPHRLADAFKSVGNQVRYWRSEFWRYDGSAYRAIPDDEMRGDLTEFIRADFVRQHADDVAKWDGKGKRPTVRPVTVAAVGNVLQALRGRCLLRDVCAPAWVDGATGPDPATILPVQNGLLNLCSAAAGQPDCLLDPNPSFFTTNSVPFKYDPAAPSPCEWLAFLRSIWLNDTESITVLQEWFGYLLSAATSLQKILFLLGPPRSGKGTIGRVLTEMAGRLNVCGPTLAGLSGNFGLSPLLGKAIAIIADARLSSRADGVVVTERLLSISGEDRLTVDRKHRDSITVKLPTRIVMMSNELPRLCDASGALAGRMVILRITESWLGREDHGLFERLRAELPGILLWAIKGWSRLRQRGRFVQPKSGRKLIEEMDNLSSPVGEFVRERCLIGKDERIAISILFAAWRTWCDQHGQAAGTEAAFGHDLRAAVPTLDKMRARTTEGGRQNFYTGIRLRTAADRGPGEDENETPSPFGHPGHHDHALHVSEQVDGKGSLADGHGGHGDRDQLSTSTSHCCSRSG